MLDSIIHNDAFNILPQIENQSIDLVLTSPPYAQQRKKQYNSITEKDYPQWTVNWMQQIKPILKPNGSVAIIIRTNIKNGCISNYILHTRLALHNDGWYEPEELLWIKPNAPPLGNTKRPRRSWEHILWFTLNPKEVYCDTKAHNILSTRVGFESKKGVGEWKQGTNKSKIGIARCRDYLEVPTSASDRNPNNTHPAQFPTKIAELIIPILCPKNGTILDPFIGSGSTAIAAVNTGRHYIGIDNKAEYCDIARNRLAELEYSKSFKPNNQN